MSVFKIILAEIVEEDIFQLVADTQREAVDLEFKRDMYGNSDAEKKEFLKDLSSLANSAGGQLIIGVDEEEGFATAVAPVPGNSDTALQRLEQIARTGLEPRIVGIQMRAVPMAAGGFVYLIRVPRSWHPPHRVSYQNSNRIYLRSSAGAHEASMEELRASFASGADVRRQMTEYVQERTQRIADNEGVMPLATEDGSGRLVLHILPLAAFAGGAQVDVSEAQQISNLLYPLGSTGIARINFDGFMMLRTGHPPHGYTQVFRNGVVEATRVSVATLHQQVRRIPMRTFLEPIYQRLPSYLRALQTLGVSPPFGISLSLIGVEGAFLGIGNTPWEMEEQSPIDRHVLVLPMQLVSDFDADASYRAAIAPQLDALFNAVGLPNASGFLSNYDGNGQWVVP